MWEGVSLLSFTCFATNLPKSRYAVIRFLEKTDNAEKFYSFMNWICDVTFNAERGGGEEFPCAIIFKWAAEPERQGELGNLRF